MTPPLYDSLDGQVALVSGANRGIGREIARRLADLGATVYAGSRSLDGFAPDWARPVRLDVTDADGVDRAVARVREDGGRLDVLVNNAGVVDDAPLHEASRADLDRVLDVNLRGAVWLTRAALPALLSREGGRVVNVSSGMGALTGGMGGGSPAYRISKTGLNGLTAYLDGEYGPDLLANAACPGWVRTRMGGESAPRSPAEGAETPVWLARFRPGAPGGRFWRNRSELEW
ncbi:MAG: SDR family NAD(P)-dependent oxidoreductase [Haloplanus sp.]